MSLRKRCSRTEPPTLADGTPNPLHCATSPRCEHHWHYDFRINGRATANTTETADKHKARDIEAKERTRILEGQARHPPAAGHHVPRSSRRSTSATMPTLHKRSAERDGRC